MMVVDQQNDLAVAQVCELAELTDVRPALHGLTMRMEPSDSSEGCLVTIVARNDGLEVAFGCLSQGRRVVAEEVLPNLVRLRLIPVDGN